MDLDLRGKHALVLGGSQGIGRASAHELALLGADVTVLSRSRDALEAVVAALPCLHGAQRHGWVAADMSDHASLRARVEALSNGADVQILVNNTGGPASGPAHSATLDDFRNAFDQHLMAAQIIVQALLPGMQRGGYGRIVNVISTSVKEPIRNLGVSNTIRGAVANWAKTLAAELGSFGITVNNVLPGYTRTGRLQQIIGDRMRTSGKDEAAISSGMLSSVPMLRFGEATEIAAVIAFLATPAAGYVNGVNIPVDGGRTLSL
ncbi:MAG: SDR family oxidoreductase [Dokdonella sp.]